MKTALASFVALVVAVLLGLLGAGTESSGWLILAVVAMVTLAVCLALVAGVAAAFDSNACADRRIASCGVALAVLLVVAIVLFAIAGALDRAWS